MCKFMNENGVQINPIHGDTPLHLAAEAGHLEIFKIIFNTVNEKSPSNIFGYTPIHTAAESGRLEVCKFIIENNEDPNMTNREGERPIHLAADNGHLEIFKFILDKVEDYADEFGDLYIRLLNPDTWK